MEIRRLDCFCLAADRGICMKKILFLLTVCLLLAGCGAAEKNDGRLQVAASFYPMAEFTKAVGGDKVQVSVLVPDGAEPHDWEPSPRDLTRLGHARVFVYNGIVEPWAGQALEALSERDILPVQAGEGLYTRSDGVNDPHVWISPRRAMEEVRRITEGLCRADAANAEYYRKNSKAYLAELSALDKRLQKAAAAARHKSFVTAHAAFGHLASDYGLRQLAVTGISPEAEPTPADMRRLIKIVRQEQIGWIFFETLTDPKISRLMAAETGARTGVLDPLEGLDEKGRSEGLNYLTIMERNIDALEKALN